MKTERDLKSIPDDELLRRLTELLGQSRRVEADLVAHIGEVDARRLYARKATPSMFVYCTRVLHLSEAEAWLRITVARASREHPMLLAMLQDGRLHLSGIRRLSPHLTRDNREVLLKRAAHRSRREIEELVAALAPRPDTPALIRKLPGHRKATQPSGHRHEGAVDSPVRGVGSKRAVTQPELGPDPVESRTLSAGPGAVPVFEAFTSGAALPAALARPGRIEPTAPSRYKVQFTASAVLRDKLERLQALMRPSVPDGDLATIIETAVTEKLERLEARRFGKTKTPRKGLAGADTSPSTRHIPAPIRRAVHERDGGRCTYTDERGRRCTARHRLEFHHDEPFGRGGDHSLKNLRLMCRTHNALLAEHDYGKEVVARYRRSPDRVSETAVAYGAARRTPGGPLLHSP